MSLSLIQGYSSASEEEAEYDDDDYNNNSSDEEGTDKDETVSHFPNSYNPVIAPQTSDGSALPSAIDAFSEVSGPPQFLNNCVEDQSSVRQEVVHHRRRNRSRDKKDLPSGAVMESKAKLVGIHERVRSDVEGNVPSTASIRPSAPTSTTNNGSQPSLCLQCGIPKMYSSDLGMVCPVCPSVDSKKKGSTVKDKEKSKRMRGQSSHATWKSETEMQLRQTFD